MSSLFQLFLLLVHFSACTNSLNSTSSSKLTLPIDVTFKFPVPIPKWTDQGKGFASGAIDLGGLEVRQIKSLNRIWRTYKGGPHDTGATFFEPSSIPDGFFMLGSYAQSNDKPLFGSVLVGKDLANRTLSQPTDYILVWSGPSANSDNTTDENGYIWLPTPPHGYKSIGYIVTKSQEKPPLGKIRCVRSDFTEDCENDAWIWGDNYGKNFYKLRPSNRGGPRGFSAAKGGARGFSAGTFFIDDRDASYNVLSCLSNLRNDFSIMPNKSQLTSVIQEFSPYVYFHPKEEFFPSSLEWLWNNRAFLYKRGDESNPIRINSSGSNLPTSSACEMYWMDLPKNESDRNIVKKGDLSNAVAYYHIKPVLGATHTDIVIWLYYPFNGNSKLKIELLESPQGAVGPFEISLGKIGEHIGDWEHLTLRVSNFDGELKSVYFSQHNYGIWVSAAELMYKEGFNLFLAFSCLHSHAFEPFPINQVYERIFGETGLLKEAEMGPYYIDTSHRSPVISAEYLAKESGYVEPKWLSYACDWGPRLEDDPETVVKDLINNSPEAAKPFLQLFESMLNKFALKFIDEERQLIGPKWRNNWLGDENIDYMF